MPKPQQIKREMSNAFGSSFHLQSSSNSVDIGGDQSIPSRSPIPSYFTADASSPSTSSLTGQLLSYANAPHITSTSKKAVKAHKRTLEEQNVTKNTKARFASRLASDHSAVLSPNVDAPFSDVDDVVTRLLPYHVFQQPKEDLELLTTMRRDKGKEKATAEDLKTELSETRFALDCFRRRAALHDRLQRIKIRSGRRSAPDDQALMIAQAVLDADRAETTSLSNELRTLRAELERIEREKRVANSARVVYYPPRPGSTATMQPQYYRGYPYAYTQAYGAPVQSSLTPTFTASPATPSPSYTPYVPSGAIPVQLPVASLPALHALGIIPVPIASLPSDGHPQPPAVLRGSTSNGSMLSLEINVSLLQPVQMSGLATVLNSLMARGSSATPVNSASEPVPPPIPTAQT